MTTSGRSDDDEVVEVKRTAQAMQPTEQADPATMTARLDRDGQLVPVAVDQSLTDLLFAGRRERPLAPMAAVAEVDSFVSTAGQAALFELV